MSEEIKEVSAVLNINVYVDCPHCGSTIDLLDENDTDGVDHNECGSIFEKACPDQGYWNDSHAKFKLDKVTCSECKGMFNVKTIEW